MASKRVRDLEKFVDRLEAAAIQAIKLRQFDVADLLEDAMHKVIKRIEGIEAQRRQKRGK